MLALLQLGPPQRKTLILPVFSSHLVTDLLRHEKRQRRSLEDVHEKTIEVSASKVHAYDCVKDAKQLLLVRGSTLPGCSLVVLGQAPPPLDVPCLRATLLVLSQPASNQAR